MDVRRTLREVIDGFGEHHLLTYASAIAYQTISSLIPFALFGLAMIGALDLEQLWTAHLRPDVAAGTSPEVFAVVDRTVEQILSHRQTFWITFGLVLTLWETGGAMRATMEALDDIYAVRNRRGRRSKYVTSTWLAAAVGALVLLALAVIVGGRSVLGGPGGGILRYVLAAVVLTFATGLVLRVAPTERPPARWVSVGSVVIVLGTLVAIGGYVFYASSIASYSSVFGSLAALFVLVVVAYVAPVVFLSGVLIDAKARERS
jgi:membrane protein